MDAKTRYLSGLVAEDQVLSSYQNQGYRLIAQRWRGGGGELDLILDDGFGGCVFVEVKKSSDHARAALRVSAAQMRRIFAAAQAFLARSAMGLATPARFDVALVDARGRIDVIENALCA